MFFDKWIIDLAGQYNGYGMLLYVLITISITAILAFLFGFERQIRGGTFNVKTHVLLSIGCSLLMTVSIWAIRAIDPANVDGKLTYDTSRIAAGVVTGMGFLGAGVIMKDKLSIRGLSTAASLWVSSGVGLACGAGFVFEAIICTVITIGFLALSTLFTNAINKRSPKILIKCKNNCEIIKIINEIATENSARIRYTNVMEVTDDYTIARVIFPLNYKQAQIKYFKNQLLLKVEGLEFL